MIKKSIIISLIFTAIALFSIPVFAESDMAKGAENTLNGIKDGVQNMASDAGRAMGDMKDGAKNVVSDMTGREDARTDRRADETTTSGYTAQRTSSTGSMTNAGTNNTTLIWTVLGITGLVILALVWYYGKQATRG